MSSFLKTFYSIDATSTTNDDIVNDRSNKFEPRLVSFRQQFSSLIIRNVLLKRRQYVKTLMQLLFPLFILSNMFFQKPKFMIVTQIDEPIINRTYLYFPPAMSHYQTWYIINNDVFDEQGIIKMINTINRIAPVIFQKQIYYNLTFESYYDFEKFYHKQLLNENFLLISFDSFKNHTLEYTIRMEKRFTPIQISGGLGDCEDKGLLDKPDCEPYKFYTYGFCTIKAIIDSSIIKFMDRSYRSRVVPNFKIGIFPQPLSFSMSKYHMKMVISFITLSFMPFFSIVPVTLVAEKEKRIKEAMHLMGMKTLPYWLSWTFVELILSVIPCLLTTIVFVILDLTIFMNPFNLFILLQLYALSLILIGFIISVPFRTTKVASIASSLTGFSIPWLFYGLELMAISFQTERYLSIFSPLAFAYTIKYSMLTIENVPLFSMKDYSLGFGILMIIIDIILYFSFIIFADVFLINKEIIMKRIMTKFRKPKLNPKLKQKQLKQAPMYIDIETIEDELQDKNLIEIMNVTKIYDKSSIAVNNLSLNIYESQITALLGQNGAGKTTLINMIIGSLQPTFGTIKICNLNVDNVFDVANLRTRFGVCFQEDIIFDELTPLEHLRFFGRIKGAYGKKLDQEIRYLLSQTDLMTKMHHNAGVLSGGQKRKLCTAIALVGGSQIILLDEPTSGVDPYSREKIWALLRSYKRNRVIMLSTHTMYEADILADRKAIVVNGSIRCCGSSMFLKNKFGVGYHLRLEVDPNFIDINNIEKLIKTEIKQSKFDRQTQNELLFTLPKMETKKFPKLFEKLDKMIKDSEGVIGYGIKLTTLEDVFLKICYESDETLMEQMMADSDDDTDGSQNSRKGNVFNFDEIHQLKFKQNNFRILWLFFNVKSKTILRNWQFMMSITIQAFVIVCFMIFTSNRLMKQLPKRLLLDTDLYPDDQSLLYANYTKFNDLKYLRNYFTSFKYVDRMTLTSMIGKHYAMIINGSKNIIDNDIEENQFTLLFNKSFQYSLPILQNAFTNMFIKSKKLNHDLNENLKQINTANYPLPDRTNALEDGLDMLFIVMFGMSLTTFPVNLATETIKERDDGIKSFLTINGMKILQYWLVTAMVDSLTFGIFVFTIMSITYLFVPLSFFVNPYAFICCIILMILYIPCSIMTCYVFSHLFNKREVAQALMSNVSSLIAGFMYIMSYVIRAVFKSNISFRINYFIWPFYIPFGALQSLSYVSKIQKKQEIMNFSPYLEWTNNILPAYVAMIAHFLIGLLLLPYLDRMKRERKSCKSIICCCRRKKQDDDKSIDTIDDENDEDRFGDEDVYNEKIRVKEIVESKFESEKPLLMIKNLHKDFKIHTAVKRLNLIIESGQIFGLLGPNGAGKTTVMKIIVRDELETSGKLYMEGVPFKDRLSSDLMAYCPQMNPLWPEITLIEHLYLYAAIRGIPGNRINDICDKLIKAFGIQEYRHRKFRKLSGGNKRKLCLLISILANVKLTMLDEPSTGMDPSSKRLMWNLIIKKFDPNGPNSAILTSHSMEEIEALCTRLAIMAKGNLKCLGNIQHLNNKYGKGYFLEIKWKKGFNFNRIQAQIIDIFPDMRINEQNPELIKLMIPQKNVQTLAKFFETMENIVENNPEIEEYNLNQSSIEQLFIEFAKIHEYVI